MQIKDSKTFKTSSEDFLKKLELHKTQIGDYYLPRNTDKDIVCQAIKKGVLFDKKIIDECRRLYLNKNDPSALMIDIGANFAQMSIEFSKFPNLLNGSLESDVENPVVLSWEAEPFVYQVALLNIQTNNKQHLIRLFPNAVWNVDDLEVSFPEPDFLKMDSWGSYGLDPNLNLQGERMIKTVAIDSLKIEQQIAFMKIDIQGSDLNALLGSVETIKRHKMPIIFEFEEMFSSKFKYTFQDYVDFVRNVNYRFEKVIENNYLIVSND